MDNWLNTKAGRDFSMRTIPDMTKAMNRLADALLVQNDLTIDERQPVGRLMNGAAAAFPKEWFKADPVEKETETNASEKQSERDWEGDAKLLYTALSRMHQADNEDMEIATEMAFDVLSSVSMDFRNEYAACKWPTLEEIVGEGHGDKRWYTDCTWATVKHHELLEPLVRNEDWSRRKDVSEEDLIEVIRQVWPQGEPMANEDEPSDLIDMRDALAKDGTDIAEILGWQTDALTGQYSPIEKAKAIVNGEFLPIELHHDGPDAWERLLNMEVGEFFWTHEPFNGENLWYRVK